MSYCEGPVDTPIRNWQLFHRLRIWLSPADSPRAADLIFALAGRMVRKEYALELFRNGLAPRILLSVGRFEIRRFSKMSLPLPLDLLKMAQAILPSERHYFVAFQENDVRVQPVPPGRFGTYKEIDLLARWLAANRPIDSLLIVSSDIHLRRIRLCCRSLLSKGLPLAFLAAPNPPPEQTQDSPLPSVSEVFLELLKLSVYWVGIKSCTMRFF